MSAPKTYRIKHPGMPQAGYEVSFSELRGGWEWAFGGDGESDEVSDEVFATAPDALDAVAFDALETLADVSAAHTIDRAARSLATRLRKKELS